VERLDKEGLAAVEPTVNPVNRWSSEERAWLPGLFMASNPVGVTGIGGYFRGYGATEEAAIAKWHDLAEKSRVKLAAWEVDLDLYGSLARNKAPFALKVAPSGVDWVSAYGKANVQPGDSAIVWGHGRYRHGVVANVSPTGKRLTVLWFSPADLKNGQRFGHRSDFNVGAVEVFS